ncbi:MAG TPA: tyrosine-type recombinase/integrase [Abditibacteriaceae bacterium]|jgi:site-specific recombinase XerD
MERPGKLQQRIAAYLAYLREVRAASPHTVCSYECDLNHFAVWLQEKGELGPKPGWQSVTHLHLRRYFNGLDGYALSSQNRQLSALKSFFKWLESEGLVKSNPTLHLAPFKSQDQEPGSKSAPVLSIAEIERLLETPDALSASGKRDRALLEVLYGTGLRVSECMALMLCDIDWRAGELCVRDGVERQETFQARKTKRSRILPLGRPALQALRDYVQNARPELAKGPQIGKAPIPTDALWLSRRGLPMSQVAIYLAVQNCGRQAGLGENITPHTLRLCCGAHLLQNGADEGVVRDLLGHRSFQFTRHYLRVKSQARTQKGNAKDDKG